MPLKCFCVLIATIQNGRYVSFLSPESVVKTADSLVTTYAVYDVRPYPYVCRHIGLWRLGTHVRQLSGPPCQGRTINSIKRVLETNPGRSGVLADSHYKVQCNGFRNVACQLQQSSRHVLQSNCCRKQSLNLGVALFHNRQTCACDPLPIPVDNQGRVCQE